MGNELVAEVKESETVWTGSRLLEDGADLKEAFESKSWVAGGLATAATVADAAAAAIDPLGEALSAGVGWIIEHLSPLKNWLNELAGDSDAVAAAASTWTNIATKLNSCATDLDKVRSSRLAGQESLAVATFKTLQAGSASHLRMTGQLAGAISGGLTVASMIVRMVHDMVRDAISDVIGKLLSKASITVLTAGVAAPWAVSSVATDVSSWATRLAKEVTDVVTSAKNLKGLLSKARRLLDDVAKAFTRIPAKVSKAVTTKVEAAKDLASTLRNPQHALAGLPGISMRQAGDMGKATPTVHRPSGGPKPPKTPRPNPNEGRWGVKLDDAPNTAKSTSKAADAAADGAKSTSHAANGAKGAGHAADAAADGAKSAEHAADAAADGAKGADDAADAAGDAADSAADGARGADDAADAAADGSRGADGAADGPSFDERHRPEVFRKPVEVKEGGDLYPGKNTPFARDPNVTLKPNTHYRVERPGGVHSDYYTDASGNVTHVECHSKWETGYLNADLQHPLPNATYSVDGKFHYVTDEHARTSHMEVDGHMEPLDKDNGEKGVRSAHTQRKVKALGDDLPGEHNGGHGAGTQFHGPPEKINVVAMLKEVNQNFPDSGFKSYLELEQKIADTPGNYKGFAVDFEYRDPVGPELTKTEQVPTQFKATWTDASGADKSELFVNH